MTKIVNIPQHMFDQDAFSQWLGIRLILWKQGYCKLKMTVREEMTNGFGIAHGGITYSLADTALAFASNSPGLKAVSIETVISHIKQVRAGDKLTAETREIERSTKMGLYTVIISNQDNELVAHFRGTVYRTSKVWEV